MRYSRGSAHGDHAGSSGPVISLTDNNSIANIHATFELRPKARAAHEDASASVAGAGVGEVGGAHWFAASDAPAAAGQAEQHEVLQATSETPGDTAEQAAASATATEEAQAEGVVRVSVRYKVHAGSGLVETEWEVDARDALPAPLNPGLTK